MIVNISEAARLTGKDRKTIRAHMGNGKISYSPLRDGTKGIEISELIRVYGELVGQAPHVQLDTKQQKTASISHPNSPPEIALLREALTDKKARIKELQALVEEQRQVNELLRGQIAGLLAAPPQSPRNTPPEPSPEVANKPWSFWRMGS